MSGGIKSTVRPWFGAASPTMMVIAGAREATPNIRIPGIYATAAKLASFVGLL